MVSKLYYKKDDPVVHHLVVEWGSSSVVVCTSSDVRRADWWLDGGVLPLVKRGRLVVEMYFLR